MTRWTYDETVIADGRVFPVAAIYLIPEDKREVRTVDLMGAHVMIDVDSEGNVVSLEIIGPAVLADLKDLGVFLGEPASILKADDE